LSRKKIVYIVSDIDKALSFEWTVRGLKGRVTLTFLLIGKENSYLSQFLRRESVPFFEISDNKYSSLLSKWVKVFRLLFTLKPDVVHTHLWQANLLGLSAAWIGVVKKRIYTRHHALVHYKEFKKGRIGDLLCNFWATDIIAISKNVQNILTVRDHADPRKIKVLYHGFDLNYFREVDHARILSLKTKYDLNQAEPIVGVIARYQEWKGIQYVIPAFEKLLEDFPRAHLVLANAQGSFKTPIQNALNKLPKSKYTEITFEPDLAALYRVFSVYVHVPIDPESEAFGQTYVESLASGVPSVFSLSGVAPEFIVDKKNALIAAFQDSSSIYDSIKRLLTDKKLSEQLIVNGRESVKKFSLEYMVQALENLYSQ